MVIYQSNSNMLPDSAYENGELRHLIVGNMGRLLDPRRTPVRITEVKSETGFVALEILDFEDKGNHWEYTFEEISRFQFDRNSHYATAENIKKFQEAVNCFDRTVSIVGDDAQKRTTMERMLKERKKARKWLLKNSRFLSESGKLPEIKNLEGDILLYEDLYNFMDFFNLWEIEKTFANQFVSNPYSGELIKGHRIILAEMGLADYKGKIVRNKTLFNSPWSKEERKNHIFARMAFVHELFKELKISTVILYRGFSTKKTFTAPQNNTFVSTSFSQKVAEAHFESLPEANGVLYRQIIPVERLFMTYFETVQMNQEFKEGEAVLLYDPTNIAF